MLRPAGRGSSADGRTVHGDVLRSSQARIEEQLAVLAAAGSAIAVHEVQGEQSFATAEGLVRRIEHDLDDVDWVVSDLRPSACAGRPGSSAPSSREPSGGATWAASSTSP